MRLQCIFVAVKESFDRLISSYNPHYFEPNPPLSFVPTSQYKIQVQLQLILLHCNDSHIQLKHHYSSLSSIVCHKRTKNKATKLRQCYVPAKIEIITKENYCQDYCNGHPQWLEHSYIHGSLLPQAPSMNPYAEHTPEYCLKLPQISNYHC